MRNPIINLGPNTPYGSGGGLAALARQLGEALLLILDGSATRRDESGEQGAEAAESTVESGEYVGDESLFQRHGSLRVERRSVVAASAVTLAVFTFSALRRYPTLTLTL